MQDGCYGIHCGCVKVGRSGVCVVGRGHEQRREWGGSRSLKCGDVLSKGGDLSTQISDKGVLGRISNKWGMRGESGGKGLRHVASSGDDDAFGL